MAEYTREEARDWAREHLNGVANVVIPSFSQDLKALSEAGIRYDIRKDIEYGFSGTLLVSEVAMSIDEYHQAMQWSVDEAAGRLVMIHHAAFNTLADNIEAVRLAEDAGAELILLSYPPNFYPRSDRDIYEYTAAFCAETNLAVILFPVPQWGFERLHPSDIQAGLIREMIDNIPNVAVIKAEGGMPSINGFVECYRLFGDEVVVTCPLENDMIPLASLVPIQFSGTSNTEYFGPMIPRIFTLLQKGEFGEASRLYWQLHPARKTNAVITAYLPHTNFIHRMQWKFQAWLTGFNGGPLRQPTMRLSGKQMDLMRQGLKDSGLNPTEDDNAMFFIGRNPED